MRVQHKKSGIRKNILLSAVLAILILLRTVPVFAWDTTACFDLSQPVKQGLAQERLAEKLLLSNKDGHFASGALGPRQGGGGYDLYWAAAEGESDRTIEELIKELLGHESTRAAQATEMKIDTIADPHFLARQDVHFGVRPFPLVHVEWKENWAVSLLDGDPQNPKKVLVTYQKESGTGYIQHLCGQFEITRLPLSSPNKSFIRVYEEAAAKGRTEQDTLSGIQTTLRKLQLQTPQPHSLAH